ncbi:MAG: hypothetical protein RL685_3279 [Pseudomonadota bacterium]
MSDDAAAQPPSESSAAGDYLCPTCGGRMAFDAARQSLLCAFCSATGAAGAGGAARQIQEHDLEAGLAQAQQRGYGPAVRSFSCEQCGARVSYGENTTASSCDFCGSARVLEQRDQRQPLRPESVIPFQIDRATANVRFSSWLGSLWFRRSDLKKLARLSEMTGMYVPYWAFDSRVASSWRAEAGYHYYVTESYTTQDAQGRSVQRTRQVQRTRWERARGSRQDHYDDLLECGSKGLSRELTRKLEPFDTGRLVPYDPSYLVGWKAEEYSLDLAQAWDVAQERMEQEQRQRCSRDVPGDTQRGLEVDSRFSERRFKHLLLPIWISVYRYRERPFVFLVNGQTGEVTGHAPWSVIKILLFSALVLGLLVAYVTLTQR